MLIKNENQDLDTSGGSEDKTTVDAKGRAEEEVESNAEAVYAALNGLSKTPPGDDKETKGGEGGSDGSGEGDGTSKTESDKTTEGGSGDGNGDDLFETPELDEKLAKDPELKARWDQQQAGLKKLYDRERELLPKIEHMAGYVDGLAKAESAPQTLSEIIKLTAANVNMAVPDLLRAAGFEVGAASSSTKDTGSASAGTGDGNLPDGLFNAHKDKFVDEGELEFANLIGGLMVQEIGKVLDQRLPPLQDAITRSQSDGVKAESEKRFNQLVDGAIAAVSGHFGKLYPGFSVTKEMLAEALTEFPQHAATPEKQIEAVRKHFSDRLLAHVQKNGSPSKKDGERAPEAIDDSQTRGDKGIDIDDPDFGAAMVYRGLQSR